VRRLITQKFLDYQYDLTKSAWGSGTAPEKVTFNLDQFHKVCAGWAQILKPGDVIISFNWDILHEVILWRSGLWSYRDGYGFQCGSQGQRDNATNVLLLKLHGSVNWVQDHDSDPVGEIANVGDFFSNSKDWDTRTHFSQAQTDSGRKLVLPTYLKDISSNRVLLKIWTAAQRLIREAREMIVLGYSLNRVDHPARLLFGTALTENLSLQNVTVCSPNGTDWPDFLSQVNKDMTRVRQKFEEWVCVQAPSSS
jgi:hypothetical protein